ncbi:hypothetical protein Y032_0154g2983 [Ancylostoma ceylanicum]|uniref:Uncharacterized protein n=1 Tax=Ancylostoma ceylanicum TaxID=53326 RepID=A0A016SZX8_9BILA|nr:hypothetical protein Y032_0154g2983 [Ancylostoma ceylanicum]
MSTIGVCDVTSASERGPLRFVRAVRRKIAKAAFTNTSHAEPVAGRTDTDGQQPPSSSLGGRDELRRCALHRVTPLVLRVDAAFHFKA